MIKMISGTIKNNINWLIMNASELGSKLRGLLVQLCTNVPKPSYLEARAKTPMAAKTSKTITMIHKTLTILKIEFFTLFTTFTY